MSATNPSLLHRPGCTDDNDPDTTTVLTALEDTDCRAILEATADESMTASELSEACDVPLSTTYRKLEILTDATLLEERIRICRSGKHATEYRKCFEDVTVSVPDCGSVEIDVEPIADSEPSPPLTQAD